VKEKESYKSFFTLHLVLLIDKKATPAPCDNPLLNPQTTRNLQTPYSKEQR